MADQGDIHDRYRAFALRDRLRLDDGTDPANHVIWTRELPEGQNLAGSLAGTLRLGAEAIEVIDEWLTALAADTTSDPVEVRLERARPDSAVDNCITGDGERITGVDVYEPGGACAERYPVSADTRIVAGAPLANDIVKCRLQTVAEAIDAGVYSVELSADDRARLEAIFPDGVCDYTRPGVGQGPVEGDWLSYPR